MSQQYNIKWREQDEKELHRVVRNFNTKLRRLVKANPENKNILPQFYNENTDQFESRITVDTVKSNVPNRGIPFYRAIATIKTKDCNHFMIAISLRCPIRTRTLSNRTKTCCATITPWDRATLIDNE